MSTYIREKVLRVPMDCEYANKQQIGVRKNEASI